MGKYFCDYCQSYLTHDSLSVRKNHLHGKQHLKLYNEYYENIAAEYPEYSKSNTDPSVENTLLSDMYRNIPGVMNKFADQHQRDSGYKHTPFKLYTPSTSVGLPNPPPNVLFVNYSNYVQKSRVSKPYYSNGNGNGHGYGHAYSTSSYNRGGHRNNFRSRERERSPRTVPGANRGHADNTAGASAGNYSNAADFRPRNPRASTPVKTEPQNGSGYGYGYGYGYGHDPKEHASRPAGGQAYNQNRFGYGSQGESTQQQRSRQGYQPRYGRGGHQRYSGQRGRSRDHY